MAQLLHHATPRNYVFGVSANIVDTSTFLKVFHISINIFQSITIKSMCREFSNYDPAKYVYEPLHNRSGYFNVKIAICCSKVSLTCVVL